jgi:hypothetical protein
MAAMTTKTYVPGYTHDIFVSYALADDQPPPGANDEWVTTFVQGLKLLLTQRLGSSEEYALKTDSAMADNTFAQSATVIIIVSRSYLGSTWCQRGDNPFLRVVQQRIQEGARVFIVELDRIDLPERPPEFGNVRSYRFWVAESAEQPPRRLGQAGSTPGGTPVLRFVERSQL